MAVRYRCLSKHPCQLGLNMVGMNLKGVRFIANQNAGSLTSVTKKTEVKNLPNTHLSKLGDTILGMKDIL